MEEKNNFIYLRIHYKKYQVNDYVPSQYDDFHSECVSYTLLCQVRGFQWYTMTLFFVDKKLEQIASDYKLSVRKLGERRAKLFHKRIAFLKLIDNLADTIGQVGHFHELVGDRKGQWACDLDQPYRLVFEPTEKPIPTDKDGKYIWKAIRVIDIVEIVDYH